MAEKNPYFPSEWVFIDLFKITPPTVGVMLVVGMFICCLLTGCQPAQKQSGPREKLTLAYTTIPNSVLVHIALAKGFFSEEGLDVTAQSHPFGKPALEAMLEGKADMATAAETPIVFAVLNGHKPAILASIQTATRNEAIVARKDRGITAITNLKGKRVGVSLGTTGEFVMDALFRVNGIRRQDVTIIDIKPDKQADALQSGEVDAVSTWNPYIIGLQKELGDRGITFYGENVYTETFCLAVTQDILRSKPYAARKVIRALVRAEEFVKKNPLESQRLSAELTGTDRAQLAAIWNLFDFSVKLDQALLLVLEDESRWAIKGGLAQKQEPPNFLEYIHIDALNSVRPDSVRIIH